MTQIAEEKLNWQVSGQYTDILYHKMGGIAKITINRPRIHNAFRPLTVQEMLHALEDARNDHEIGVIILTGAGEKPFVLVVINQSEAMQDIQMMKVSIASMFSISKERCGVVQNPLLLWLRAMLSVEVMFSMWFVI